MLPQRLLISGTVGLLGLLAYTHRHDSLFTPTPAPGNLGQKGTEDRYSAEQIMSKIQEPWPGSSTRQFHLPHPIQPESDIDPMPVRTAGIPPPDIVLIVGFCVLLIIIDFPKIVYASEKIVCAFKALFRRMR